MLRRITKWVPRECRAAIRPRVSVSGIGSSLELPIAKMLYGEAPKLLSAEANVNQKCVRRLKLEANNSSTGRPQSPAHSPSRVDSGPVTPNPEVTKNNPGSSVSLQDETLETISAHSHQILNSPGNKEKYNISTPHSSSQSGICHDDRDDPPTERRKTYRWGPR